jgi:hypothetical protein
MSTQLVTRSAQQSRVKLVCAVLLVALASGCAAYRFGATSLYPPDVQSVYVPVFESDSLRRNLGERLTEAVIKEIELKTPYKVVSDPNADSVLSGRILNDLKRVTVEDAYDQQRENQITILAEVSWLNRRGDLIASRGNIPIPESLLQLAGTGVAVPEFGQSIATGQQQAINRMAEQIVSLMETPW